MTLEDFETVMREHFPLGRAVAQEPRATLDFVSATALDGEAFEIVVRLVVWETARGQCQIRDVKEQEVYRAIHGADVARLATYLAALNEVLIEVFRSADVGDVMPHELLDLTALELVRATRQDQFAKALCKKSRLGKFLPLPKRS